MKDKSVEYDSAGYPHKVKASPAPADPRASGRWADAILRLLRKASNFFRPCEHFWRPGVQEVAVATLSGISRSNRPVRVCDDCGKRDFLTVPEFYGQFGRMPW
jgi:hypothetical protein